MDEENSLAQIPENIPTNVSEIPPLKYLGFLPIIKKCCCMTLPDGTRALGILALLNGVFQTLHVVSRLLSLGTLDLFGLIFASLQFALSYYLAFQIPKKLDAEHFYMHDYANRIQLVMVSVYGIMFLVPLGVLIYLLCGGDIQGLDVQFSSGQIIGLVFFILVVLFLMAAWAILQFWILWCIRQLIMQGDMTSLLYGIPREELNNLRATLVEESTSPV
eukprot:GHVP01061829.1.p1 GENE.GHVP01061829.1~~GHVP01061829.1.p1  ORF type:complete len:218 (+),score=26.37 GHVP01061829.1:96-749(+)